MNTQEVWDVMRDVVKHVTGLDEVIEAFDKRPASERLEAAHATLSLHKITPAAMATVTQERVDDHLVVTHRAPSEIEFHLTIHRAADAMRRSFAMHSVNVNEQAKLKLFENEMSIWKVIDHDRDPKTVNESYEDSAKASIIVAAVLTTTEIVNFADKVDFTVNGITGSAESKDK